MKLEDIFIDYLKSGGSWMESTLVVSSSSKKSKELKSNEVFMRYCDLKKRDGAVTAKLIRDEKRLLQDELDKKPKIAGEEPLPYIFAHPDLPGSEDRAMVVVRIESLPPDFDHELNNLNLILDLTGLGADQGV